MSADLLVPAGLWARPPTVDDAALILGLILACDMDVLGYPDCTEEEVRSDLSWPGLDLDRDAWLVLDTDGAAAGYGYAYDEQGSGMVEAELYVRPGADPEVAAAIATQLLAAAEQRAGQIAAAHGRPEAVLTTGNLVGDEQRAAWLATAGWAPVRRFHRMIRPLDGAGDVLQPLAAGPGVLVRPVRGEDPDDLRVFHDLLERSFVGHFGWTASTHDHWLEVVAVRSDVADRSLWWVAEVDGVPAAVVMAGDRLRNEGGGWVNALGVLPQFRGRGLGRLLLLTAVAEFARRGRTKVGLGVDTGNETGALRLYESAGFAPVMQTDAWRKTVPAAGSPS